MSASPAADLIIDGGAIYLVDRDVSFNNGFIGNLSTGAVNRNGFTNTLIGNLSLSYSPGSSGVYNLSRSSLSATFEAVGYQGLSVFNQPPSQLCGGGRQRQPLDPAKSQGPTGLQRRGGPGQLHLSLCKRRGALGILTPRDSSL
jgi:hypothetical protein